MIRHNAVLLCRLFSTERVTQIASSAKEETERTGKLIQFKSEKLEVQKVFGEWHCDLNPLSTLVRVALNVESHWNHLMLTKLFSYENSLSVVRLKVSA